MDYELIIRPEARSELLDTFHWYQEQRPGLGFDFKLCVDEAISKLQNAPPFIRKYIMILGGQLLKDSRLVCFT